MLRAAAANFASTAAPSMISALLSAALAKVSRSALVLASSSAARSQTISPPARCLADRAWRSASARTFLGRSCSWLRDTGPMARPPPRNCGTRAEPWRAPPVPFCLYIFLPVRLISARPSVLWSPDWRLASCQRTMRAMMSARGSRPKIASLELERAGGAPSIDVMSYFTASFSLRLGGAARPTLRREPGTCRAPARPSAAAS